MVNAALNGLSCPVYCAPDVDWERNYSSWTVQRLLALDNRELAAVDPLAINLIVAREIPGLADLDISRYQRELNAWADDFQVRCMPQWLPYFYQAPQDFCDDIRFFQLGMLQQYLDWEARVHYKPEYVERQTRGETGQLYTDPADLFLHGIIDSREGTCATMAALQMAMGWRLGWPVSLACVVSHLILRFDDGEKTYNLEATDTGRGGWSSRPDAQYAQEYHLTRKALESGSDLRALRPREVLAIFVGLRARHYQDCAKAEARYDLYSQAETDWLLARHLFPANRNLYKNSMGVSALRGEDFFDDQEIGHPRSLADWLLRIYGDSPDPMDKRLSAAVTCVTVSPRMVVSRPDDLLRKP